VRSPRVVKAFIFHECLQDRPNAGILGSLQALLPAEDASWTERFLPDGYPSDRPKAPPAVEAAPSAVLAPSTPPPVPPEAAPVAVFAPEPAATPGSPETSQDAVPEKGDCAPDATAGAAIVTEDVTGSDAILDEAGVAFDDGQFDRAFEIILSRPLQRKSLMRLLACAQFIGTAEARARLLEAFDADPQARADLSADQIQRFEALRPPPTPEGPSLP
jgi:hypothetical protein